jgi:sec-independent protein translocase protein TatA
MHLGAGEMLVVLVIALLVFGPSKLPQLGDALGKGIRNFKKGVSGEEPSRLAHGEASPALTDGASGVRTTSAAGADGEAAVHGAIHRE